MPLSDFNHLLRDLRTGFGEPAWPEWSQYVNEPIRGRLAINPFQVMTDPSENGLSVTQIFFYYDARFDLPNTVRRAKLGDFLNIRNIRWEVVDVQDDDLGESGLQLLRAQPLILPAVTWDDGGTTWMDDVDGPTVTWPR
jgi:hypothetical protein